MTLNEPSLWSNLNVVQLEVLINDLKKDFNNISITPWDKIFNDFNALRNKYIQEVGF